MTDEQKAELTRLAREDREASIKYWTSQNTSDYPSLLSASLAAEKRLADALLAAGVDCFVADGVEFRRNGNRVTVCDPTFTLP